MANALFDRQKVFGTLEDGRLTQIGWYTISIPDAKYVGGKIFYIDSTASGATYTFYDKKGNTISNVAVGDEPYAYTVTGIPNKDKFYVFNANAVTSKKWTYQKDGDWVYNSLGTTDGIGAGRANTNIVTSADDGAYVSYADTIWNSLNSLNTNEDKGCNDWFVPSKAELEQLRIARDKDRNVLTTLFSNTYIWSSFEQSDNYAQCWTSNYQTWNYGSKYYAFALLAARAF